MNLKDFKKAESIVKDIESMSKLIKDYSLGKVSDSVDFTENNDDFYNASFLRVFETKGYHSTGGGSCDLSRLTICKHSDMSGAKYELNKSETIKLQSFIKALLDDRLLNLTEELDNI